MSFNVLNILQCPNCRKKIKKWYTPKMKCSSCGYEPIEKDGLYYVHRTDETWDKCVREKEGWIKIAQKLGIYFDNEDYLYLPDGKPHLAEHYKHAKRSIDKLLEIQDFNNKVCLDVGAGVGWVESYILKHVKTNLIALECNDDPLVGLGKSPKLKEHHGCDYVSLVADMHNIPLADQSVDIVFMVDALHHFTHLDQVIAECKRVLKPGGKFWAINEPFRHEGVDEAEYSKEVAPMEHECGIIERRPTIQEYLDVGSPLNLKVMNSQLNFEAPGLILRGTK